MKTQGVFFSMQNDTTALIDIVGVIGWQVEYKTLRDMILQVPSTAKSCTFKIYSPGGDVMSGNGIAQEIGLLSKRGVQTIADIQVGASMATVIGLACDKRTIASNGRFLVHNAWTETVGDADAHEANVKMLRDIENETAQFYADRCGKGATKASMLALMAEDRWMTPKEAKKLGFVHEIVDPFAEDTYKQVREEMIASGKMPKGFADLPPVNEAEEKTPVAPVAPVEAVAVVVPVVPPVPPIPAVPPVVPVVAIVEQAKQEDPNASREVPVSPVAPTSATPQSVPSADAPAPKAEASLAGCDATGCENNSGGQCSLPQMSVDEEGMCSNMSASMKTTARAKAQLEISGQMEEMRKKMVAKDEVISAHQSAKDLAIAENVRMKKSHEAEIVAMSASLDEVTAKLRDANERHGKLLSGGLGFSHDPQSWLEALSLCKNDYVACAKKYPELQKKYIEAHRQK